MSIRNQLRGASKMLSGMTGAMLAKEVREVIASFEKPEWQNEKAMLDAQTGVWLTAAQVKETFGPDYATNHIVIEQTIAAYAGRLAKAALEKFGLSPMMLNEKQLADYLSITNSIEKEAFVRLTAN